MSAMCRRLHLWLVPCLAFSMSGQVRSEPPLEMQVRLEHILETVTAAGLSLEQVRDLRAVEVLEQIGTAEAKSLLKKLSSGAKDARLTQEVEESLKRLAKRPITP